MNFIKSEPWFHTSVEYAAKNFSTLVEISKHYPIEIIKDGQVVGALTPLRLAPRRLTQSQELNNHSGLSAGLVASQLRERFKDAGADAENEKTEQTPHISEYRRQK